MAIGFGEVTMQGALGTTFSTLAAQQTAKRLGASPKSVPAAQAPQGNILKPPAPQLGVPVTPPAGSAYAASVGRTRAPSSSTARAPSPAGQPPLPAAAAATPPIAIAPPPAAVELPPLEASPVAALVAPPSTVQPGIPSSLPSEGVAFVQSTAPRLIAEAPVAPPAASSTAYLIGGGLVLAGLAWVLLRR